VWIDLFANTWQTHASINHLKKKNKKKKKKKKKKNPKSV